MNFLEKHLAPARYHHGGIAQLVERQLCKLDVRGSNPLASTFSGNGLVAQLVELTLDKRAVTGSSPVWPTPGYPGGVVSSLIKNKTFDRVRAACPPGKAGAEIKALCAPRLTGLPVRFWREIFKTTGSLTSASRKKERYRELGNVIRTYGKRSAEGGNKLQQHARKRLMITGAVK